MGKNASAKDFQIDIFRANPRNIWNYKQNHPEYIVEDCRNFGFTDANCEIVRQSLLVRGVNKWFQVRRDIIVYKIQIQHEIRRLHAVVKKTKAEATALFCTKNSVVKGEKTLGDYEAYIRKQSELYVVKGQLKVWQSVRGTLKELCMAPRWQKWNRKSLKDMTKLETTDPPHNYAYQKRERRDA